MLRFQDLTEVKVHRVLLVQLVPAEQLDRWVPLDCRVSRVLLAQPVFKEQQVGIVVTHQGVIFDRSMLK